MQRPKTAQLPLTPTDRQKPAEVCWRHKQLEDVVLLNGEYQKDFVPHMHDFMTLVLVTRGTFRLRVDDFIGRAEAGDVIAIGPNQLHGASPVSKDGWAMRTIQAPAHMFVGNEDGCGCDKGTSLRFERPLLPNSAIGASLIKKVQKVGPQDTTSQAETDFLRLSTWFRKNACRFTPKASADADCDLGFKGAKSLILDELFSTTSIEEISKRAGMSVYTFIRRFKREFGVSPHSWRVLCRIEEAARMLGEGKRLVNVAYDCGFSDQAHLSRSFKRVYGVTPGQYRARFEM